MDKLDTLSIAGVNAKPSQFNEYLGVIDGRWVIYNNLSCAMIDVKEDLYNAISSNRLASLSPQNILTLKQAKFLVGEKQNEAQEIRDKKKLIQDNHEVIGLQILPTSICNFKCKYCFESQIETRESMSIEVMDQIIAWVVSKIKPTSKILNIMWFGGEPLLAIDQIQYLSKAFLDIMDSNNLTYHASIVTNGYLLTEKNIDFLLHNKVSSCTVTIDGPESVHDSRRMLKNGEGTWRRILNNVKLAINKGLHVTIRINLDKTNCDFIDQLLENLSEENILNKVRYYFGNVTHFGQVCSSVEEQELSEEETAKLFKKKNITEIISGSQTFNSPITPDFVGCLATSIHSYVVGPKGELYKCTKSIGIENEICGNIAGPDDKDPDFLKWLDLNNFNSELCGDCSRLPICRGKVCPFDILHNSGAYDSCPVKESNPDYHDRLIKLYQNKMFEQIKNSKQEVPDE